MQTVIHDFTGVYGMQPFMQELRSIADKGVRYIDCTQIAGTDCYCDDEAVKAIRGLIADAGITDARGIHFFDNGNYHYMSKIWTDMVQEPFSLVVFDHHPDMQEPRFGNILSCGGWVKKVLEENKFVDSIVVIGVADHLTREIPSHSKVSYLRESEYNAMINKPGDFERFVSDLKTHDSPLSSSIYISIDKDALAPAYAATNWDQGSLSTESLKRIIAGLAASHKILGIDICGERARDTEDSRADALNSELNRELAEFLAPLVAS